MTVTTSTSSGISQRTNLYAAAKMLEHAEPVLVLEKFGDTKPMPRNKSDTIKFRRPVPFTASTVPLVEGTTPTSRAFSYEDESVTLKQYADLVTVTDVIEDTHEDPVINDVSMICGENIGRTREALTWGVLKAGSNVEYANGSSRGDVNTPITLNKQRAVVRTLKAQKARPVTRMLSGSPDYNTTPVEGGFVAVAHTDLEADIRGLANFVPVAEYGSRSPLCNEELGTVENVRYILSPDLTPFQAEGAAVGSSGMIADDATNVDVYPVIYFGMHAYGLVALRGRTAVSPSIIPPGKIDKSDPLGQRGYIGWKMWFAALILNDNWMVRLEVGATDL